jgi:hypothetical protein
MGSCNPLTQLPFIALEGWRLERSPKEVLGASAYGLSTSHPPNQAGSRLGLQPSQKRPYADLAIKTRTEFRMVLVREH